MVDKSDQSETLPEQPLDLSETQPEPQARKRSKVPLEVREQKLAPKPSFWPLLLALMLVLTLVGVMIGPVVFGFGVILTIVAIVGWTLEKH